MSSSHQITKEIIDLSQRLNQKNYLASADGNISYRVSDEEILITPTGVNKALMTAREIATITLKNEILSGKPSSERLMHLEIYKTCKKAKAVVHAHPPTAIALSIARPHWQELPASSLSELILAVGRIPFVPYARPGSQDMGDVLKPFLPDSRLMVLSRHGAIAWGDTLEEAYNGIERLEHAARIIYLAETLGGATSLPHVELEHLYKMREKLGPRIL